MPTDGRGGLPFAAWDLGSTKAGVNARYYYMMMGIPIEEEDTCIEWTYSEEHYLYDQGMLLAIFDRYDNVGQFYVNGPGGQVAVYKDNDQSYLYYFNPVTHPFKVLEMV